MWLHIKLVLVNAYQLQGMTTTEIATETGISSRTVNYYLHRYNIPVRQGTRLYRVAQNVEGFLVPSTDWHAYWIGFIAADGCIYRASGSTYLLRLKLASKDKHLLENFRKVLMVDSPIREVSMLVD
jgi:hypothetical protein